jgi:ribulose-phosphate 3-epimerase
MTNIKLHLGVKTDPIEYRFSFEWLFRLMADEGIRYAQLGSFFELYQLPDDFFINLRQQAEAYGVHIASLFTAHRELGGFFRHEHPAWEQVARRNFQRLVEVGTLLGAEMVGSNPGAVVRDQMDFKPEGLRRYIRHMKELMEYAHQVGVPCLTIEPMSCLAEPPTLPDEIGTMAEELLAYHHQHPDGTAAIGYCVDVSHGYADQAGSVRWDNRQLLEAALPYMRELHLKNTDSLFNATFGFSEADRAKGIVQIEEIRDLLLANAGRLPVTELVGYLEIGGPKTGRDYSDYKLEGMLRESLGYLRETFSTRARGNGNDA